MNLHHLKYFLAITEEGSLTAASRKLLVGQPALSAQLKQFENWIGTKLFDRQGKKLVLTSTGTYVLKYARAIKDLEDELLFHIGEVDQLSGKELSLGAQESVPKSVLANAIDTIWKKSKVRIKVREGTGEELFDLLTANKLDIFVGNFRPLDAKKALIYKSLSKEDVYIYGPKGSEKLRKGFPTTLEGKSFVLPDFHNPLRHDFEKFMLQAGLSFNVGVEAQDTALQKELTSRGEFLLLLGEESAKTMVSSGRLVKIGPIPGVREEYWLGMVKKVLDNDLLSSIVNEF